jgi:hypothetical protein
MSNFNDKALKSVAEAAAKIMGEALVGNQHKIDANKNGKVDAHDFKLLRGKKTMKEGSHEKMASKDHDKDGKVESGKAEYQGSRIRAAKMAGKLKEDEQLEEGGMPSSVIKHKQSLAAKTPEQLHAGFKEVAGRMGKSVEHVARSLAWSHGYGKGAGQGSSHYYDKVKHLEPKSESVEQIDEYNSKGGVYKHKGKYGYQGTGAEHGVSDHEKDTDMDDLDYQKKSKKLGARQNMGKRGQSDGTKKKKTNESFTEMLEMYNEHGLKYLAELGRVEEDVLIDETPGQDIQVINADIQNGYAEMTVEEVELDEVASAKTLQQRYSNVEKKHGDESKKDYTSVKGRSLMKKIARTSYNKHGVLLQKNEEVDNDTFTKEMKDQKAKFDGKKKGGDVAKPSVQAVKQEEVEQIDELSKKTLSMYVKKAHYAGGMADFKHGRITDKRGDSKDKLALSKTSEKRRKGITKAVDRLTKKD